MLLFCVNTYAYSQIIFYTPKGTQLSATEGVNTWTQQEIEQKRAEDFYNFPNIVEIAPANNSYNCFSYALYSNDYQTNHIKLVNTEEQCYLLDGSYVQGTGEVGEILAYSIASNEDDNTMITHMAVIESNPMNINPNITSKDNCSSIMVSSKWGGRGLYYHSATECPDYNAQYGGTVTRFLKSFRVNYDIVQTISTNTTYLSYSFNNCHQYRKIIKLAVQNEMDISINVSSTNGSVNSSFYDYKMQLIDDNLIRYDSTYSGSYIYHLNQGVYYYSVYFENPNVTGTISTKVRKLDSTFDNAIMLDPGTGYLVGSEISILSQYYSGVDLYGYNTIHNGFTRLLYFDSNLVLETSRLDYYYVTSNSDELFVTPYGTILAKNVDGYDNVMIYAFNKNDPSLVYRKNIIVNEYLGPDIYLSWDIHPYLYDEDYLYIEDEAPFNFLQFYYWYSTNSNVITVDSIGYYRCLSQGICYIYGDSIFNDKVHLQIYVTAG